MFESDLFEYFSRIHPVTPFMVWGPITGYIGYRSWTRGMLANYAQVLLILAGLFAWSLAEYLLHRYVFHWAHPSAWGKRVHFLLHGVHHQYPQDRDRLVMPVGASAPLAIIFYTLFYAAFGGARLADPFFVGFTIGYLIYDGSHFALHHFAFKSRTFRKLKRHHMLHHHADRSGGFGVSSPLWDYVFGTVPSVRTNER
jgi:sterol desaturase/sphingolipid hydroxylase (fatty acid hydroxylase superfamily)